MSSTPGSSLSEILKIIDELEDTLSQCRKGLLRVDEASGLYSRVIGQIPKMLEDGSTAYRIFDRENKGAWWPGDNRYLTGDQCGNLERLLSVLEAVAEQLRTEAPVVPERLPREPTGWERVDQGLAAANAALERAANEEQFQSVGLMCREVLISLAQAVYDPEAHRTPDGVPPSATDANSMLEAYIDTELGGGRNSALRGHVKSSLKLANDLQHRRTATQVDAALCLEGTRSVVSSIAIVAKDRETRGDGG